MAEDRKDSDDASSSIAELEEAIARLGRALRKIKIDSPLLSREIDITTFWQLTPLRGDKVLRPSELATMLGLDNSTVSRQLQKYESQGLVERRADPKDARASLVALSPIGRDLVNVVTQARRDKIGTVLDHWDQEAVSNLLYFLKQFIVELEELPN
ncbi:MAG: MarR family transcriptional regulator [Actinomycetota bacterium]|nr:MarR family transcriptional regulator [Actinomycetota bacterium]